MKPAPVMRQLSLFEGVEVSDSPAQTAGDEREADCSAVSMAVVCTGLLFCARCGSAYSADGREFCPGCGTRRCVACGDA
jgi:membrane protease subunit (stomatin/prohibitin family)